MSQAKHTPGPWFVGGYIHDEEDPESYPEWVVQRATPAGDLSIAVALHVQNPEMHEANARLIAAAPEILAALAWREQFERRPEEDSTENFERIAEVFYRETGHLRPGKNCVFESPEVRQTAWDDWVASGIYRMRAAIKKAGGCA